MPNEPTPKPYKKLKIPTGNPIIPPSYAAFINQNPAVATTWDDVFPTPPPEILNPCAEIVAQPGPLLELNLKAKKQDEWHKVTSLAGLEQYRAEGRALEFYSTVFGERLPMHANTEYNKLTLEKLLEQVIYVHSFLQTRVCCVVKRLHKITGEIVFARWHGPSLSAATSYREQLGANFLGWIGPMVSFIYNEETDILNV